MIKRGINCVVPKQSKVKGTKVAPRPTIKALQVEGTREVEETGAYEQAYLDKVKVLPLGKEEGLIRPHHTYELRSYS